MNPDEDDDNSFVIVSSDNEDNENDERAESPALNQENIPNPEDIATEVIKSSKCQEFTNLIFRASTRIANFCCPPEKQKQDEPPVPKAKQSCLCW